MAGLYKKLHKNVFDRHIDFTFPTNYPNNKIRIQSYTVLNILPKTLLEEFQNISCVWFLFVIAIEFSSFSQSLSLR